MSANLSAKPLWNVEKSKLCRDSRAEFKLRDSDNKFGEAGFSASRSDV